METKKSALAQIRNYIRESINRIFMEEKYPDVRNSHINAMRLNGVTFDVKNDKNAKTYYIDDNLKLVESIDFEFNKKGGIIIFSTDVNALKISKNRIENFIHQKLLSLKNRILKNKKVSDILKKHKEVQDVGFTIGNFVKGGYKANDGKIYNERSSSVEVIGVDSDILQSIAEDVCLEFSQESVLVKDYQRDKIYIVKP